MRFSHPRSRGLVIALIPWVTMLGCRGNDALSLVDLADGDRAEVELRGDARPSLTPELREELVFDVELPSSPKLSFAIAVASPRAAERARVDFRVRVVSGEFSVTVFQKSLRVDEHNRWHDTSVDLAAWAGKSVELRFETFPTRTRGDAPVWADRVTTVWGAPEVHNDDDRESAPDQPSAILIVVDTLRHDFLGIHGFQGDISTNLDWLALESARFDMAFAPAPWTKPTVATILSGLHPQTHGVLDKSRRGDADGTDTLSEDAETLAEVFAGGGYDTAAFVGNAWLGAQYGFAQGFDTYFVDNRDRVLIDAAREWLASREAETPYFLYLHLINVHGPYRAPESDYLALLPSPSLSPDRKLTAADPLRPSHFEATPFARTDEKNELRSWKAKYAATVRQLDRRLGALLGELRGSGELDESWVVFASDHGEEFLEHDSWEHGYSLCDHQLRVPLWIRAPGARTAGRVMPEVVSLVDVMPTLLGVSSLPVPDRAQGTDRSSWLTNPRDGAPESGTAVALGTGIMNRPNIHSLRTDRHHLVWDASSDRVELFDTHADPSEVRDIAATEPELAAHLRQLLRTHLQRIEAFGTLDSEVVPITDDVRERLRALGYVP